MMAVSLWLTFALTYTALCILPGPSIAVTVSQALRGGMRAAAFCVAGDMLATLVLISVSLLGVGAFLAASATAFAVLKWCGVVYLALLGLMMLRDADRTRPQTLTAQTSKRSFYAGFLTGVLNPKGVAFYMAFLAQFIDPTQGLVLQLAVIVPTIWVILAVTLLAYAFVSLRVNGALVSERSRRWIGYGSGSMLLGASAVLATQRNT